MDNSNNIKFKIISKFRTEKDAIEYLDKKRNKKDSKRKNTIK